MISFIIIIIILVIYIMYSGQDRGSSARPYLTILQFNQKLAESTI